MNFLLFEHILLTEAATFKVKRDFSGKKWGAQLIDLKTYQFKIDNVEYFFDCSPYMLGTMQDQQYGLSFDIYLKKKGVKTFDLIETPNVFQLISTVEALVLDTITDLHTYGYKIGEVGGDYKMEKGETKNIRSVIFNRPVENALRKLDIRYNKQETPKPNLEIFTVIFKFLQPY